mmetsp:Transcript_923/g.2913  ORF Transcript_923/g.2913 Transcript_923/m.2913 type:complete len:370 (-) Transcript_923:388-1497(-)
MPRDQLRLLLRVGRVGDLHDEGGLVVLDGELDLHVGAVLARVGDGILERVPQQVPIELHLGHLKGAHAHARVGAKLSYHARDDVDRQGERHVLLRGHLEDHDAQVRVLLRALRAGLHRGQRGLGLPYRLERVLAHRLKVEPHLLELGALELGGRVAVRGQLLLDDAELLERVRGAHFVRLVQVLVLVLQLGRNLPVLLRLDAELEVGEVVAHHEHAREALDAGEIDRTAAQRPLVAAVRRLEDGQVAYRLHLVPRRRQQLPQDRPVIDGVEEALLAAELEILAERLGGLVHAPVGRLPAGRAHSEDDVVEQVEGMRVLVGDGVILRLQKTVGSGRLGLPLLRVPKPRFGVRVIHRAIPDGVPVGKPLWH